MHANALIDSEWQLSLAQEFVCMSVPSVTKWSLASGLIAEPAEKEVTLLRISKALHMYAIVSN